MRSHDDVLALEDRMLGEGLVREDVEGRAPDLAGVEAGDQRVEVDQLATGAVDDAHARLELGDRVGVDPVDRLRGLRQVDGEQVGPAVELVDGVHAFDPELTEPLGGDELVEGQDLHVEGLRPLGDELADPAETDHAQGLAVELGALVLGAVPPSGDERAVRLRHVAEQRQGERQSVLGRGDGVRLRGVGDDDPALGGARDVDVVDTGAGPADHLHVVGAADQLRGQLGRRPDQDRVELADPLGQLGVIHVEPELDVKLFPQEVHTGVGDLLLDENSGPVAQIQPPSWPDRVNRLRSRLSRGDPGIFDHPVDAGRERLDVGGFDRREHRDPQLVAAELAVGLDVDDAIGS